METSSEVTAGQAPERGEMVQGGGSLVRRHCLQPVAGDKLPVLSWAALLGPEVSVLSPQEAVAKRRYVTQRGGMTFCPLHSSLP